MRKFFGWLSIASFVVVLALNFVLPHSTATWVIWDYLGDITLWIFQIAAVLNFVGMIMDNNSVLSTKTIFNEVAMYAWLASLVLVFFAIAAGSPASGIVYPLIAHITYFYVLLGWPIILMGDIVYKAEKARFSEDPE